MRVIWKGPLYSRRCLPNLISKRGSIEQGKFLLSSQESMLPVKRHTWSKFNVSLFVFHIPKWGGVSPWDSIGSYLEWGPSAHNGNANWATKCGKNSPRVKYVCTGKSPACQISLLYHSLFPLLLLHRRLLMLLWSAIHALPIEPKCSKKTQIWIVPSHWVQISPYP